MSLILLGLAVLAVVAVPVTVVTLDRICGRAVSMTATLAITVTGALVAIGLILAAGEVSS